MLTNYHSHSLFCDGKASIEEFVVAAIEAGFSEWGASCHCPLPMLKEAPWAIKLSDVDRYIDEIERVKLKYKDRIRVLAGMEIDYIDESYNPSSEYFQNLPLDFRIGSVHLLQSPRTGELVDVDCGIDQFERAVEYHFAGSLQKVVEAYYAAMVRMVTLGGFDFVGHSGKVSLNASALSSKITQKEWYKKLVDDFFVLCASKGVTLEINTKAYQNKGVFFPDEQYFARIIELGIPVVINSDAHRLDRIGSGLVEAHELFGGAGGVVRTL